MGDTFRVHTHQDAGHAHLRSERTDQPERVLHEADGFQGHSEGPFNSNPVGSHTGTGHANLSEAGASETAPVHMAVVWIMRIK